VYGRIESVKTARAIIEETVEEFREIMRGLAAAYVS
jgi:hypothetical protein